MKEKKTLLQRGFTLIELLVVIGILGILATALVATIDPFEQIRKANDTNVKNTIVEYLNANLRYYTTRNYLPWSTSAGSSCGTANALPMTTLSDLPGCMANLVNDGELKSNFTGATTILDEIIITGTSNSATACYTPRSKAGQREADTKYSSLGVTRTGCKSQTSTGGVDCYYCAQI